MHQETKEVQLFFASKLKSICIFTPPFSFQGNHHHALSSPKVNFTLLFFALELRAEKISNREDKDDGESINEQARRIS